MSGRTPGRAAASFTLTVGTLSDHHHMRRLGCLWWARLEAESHYAVGYGADAVEAAADALSSAPDLISEEVSS